jgi:hypothetical protein
MFVVITDGYDRNPCLGCCLDRRFSSQNETLLKRFTCRYRLPRGLLWSGGRPMPVRPYIPQPVTAERLERALVALAYFIELDGDVHLPMYEKLEAELEATKRKDSTRDRARELLKSERGMTFLAALKL